MAVMHRWTEVEDPCLGPDRETDGRWRMYLFVHRCTRVRTRRGAVHTRQTREVITLEGKTRRSCEERLVALMDSPNVVLILGDKRYKASVGRYTKKPTHTALDPPARIPRVAGAKPGRRSQGPLP